MGNTSNNLSELIRSLLGKLTGSGAASPKPAPSSPAPSTPPDSTSEPAQLVTARVLLVIYDPIMDPVMGLKLSQRMGWHRPDELVSAYIGDIMECSSGFGRCQIVQRMELNEFPQLMDGYRYTPQAYLDVVQGRAAAHTPSEVNYTALLNRLNVLTRVANNEIDEVWVFAFPHAGFYESAMGGSGAFWCNAPVLPGTSQCPRRFIVMGFSYERAVGEMLESFGHRCESLLEKTFSRLTGEANLYRRFITYDKVAPGRAEVGNIHFAPNSERDYDWGNRRQVASFCDDWYRFPNFTGQSRQVNCAEWGNGDIRLHHKWWLKHLPHVAGRRNGIAHNWWQYIMDPNRIPV